MHRMILLFIIVMFVVSVFAQWYYAVGFDPFDARWWVWIGKVVFQNNGLPVAFMYAIYWSGAGLFLALSMLMFFTMRPGTRNISGGVDARNTHGSARWATWQNIKQAGLVTWFGSEPKKGVVVGGFKRKFRTVALRHDGPEHILAFAPTRSGKGVSLVLPTLLKWKESALILDIKGENYALSAGWRQSIGQRVLRFEPTAVAGGDRYNPLSEVRLRTDYEIADCQNIATMLIDPEGKGMKDFWMQSGYIWLAGTLLHVLYRIERFENRLASLTDVYFYLSTGGSEDEPVEFDDMLIDAIAFEHGNQHANRFVRSSMAQMQHRKDGERSGVHSTALVQLFIYTDPIITRNTSVSDFRLNDLMNGDAPTSLYIVIPPSDIVRMKPILRIFMNQLLTRLTSSMEFEGGAASRHYKHRLLLMLDEFTSIGKLEVFEKALAFIAGYGLKAFIVIQDLTQLHKDYGKDEAITSNCHVSIAYAAGKQETAKVLSDMTGKTTIVQKKRSVSYNQGKSSTSVSINEVARSLMMPDEIRSLPAIRKGVTGAIKPGDMLIFVAGHRPIYGRQKLYFQDKVLKARAAIPPPLNIIPPNILKEDLPEGLYETVLKEITN